MLLIDGDNQSRDKIFKKIDQLGPFISVVAYIAGLVYFVALPHEALIHRTYISENALLPGLVSSDINSNDLLNLYYDQLKSYYESKKRLDAEFINELFNTQTKIESYLQHFNVSNPFSSTEKQFGKNVYAFGTAKRADGSESIVVSAPMYLAKGKNKQAPNLVGISQLFVIANLVRNQPYWAKNLIFVVTDVGQIGIQAWINSYYDIESKYVKAENLKRRAGSIQAALNLEMKDLNMDKLELKLEGPNGKLPNLDLFNTVIRICKSHSIQLKCSLESEVSASDEMYYDYYEGGPIDHLAGVQNTIQMMFKQASGVPTSSHGYFLNHRIEALTITGKLVSNRKQNFKQNLLKVSRIIESTLRSINNLLERFHQSFFFYLLSSSNTYVSIGMYMPTFGLIALPLAVQIVKIWWSIFFEKSLQSELSNVSAISLITNSIAPHLLLASAIGIFIQFATSYFIQLGRTFNLTDKNSLVYFYLGSMVNILFLPLIVKRKPRLSNNNFIDMQSQNVIKFITLIALVIFLGASSLLNFSFAFFIALFYVPICILSIQNVTNILFKVLQIVAVIVASPPIYISFLYTMYLCYFERFDLTKNYAELFDILSSKLFELAYLAKTSHIWTYNLINLCLVPIWTSFWLIVFPK